MVYRTDSRYGKDSGKVEKTSNFDMPLNRDRSGEWKLQNDGFAVATCLTSVSYRQKLTNGSAVYGKL